MLAMIARLPLGEIHLLLVVWFGRTLGSRLHSTGRSAFIEKCTLLPMLQSDVYCARDYFNWPSLAIRQSDK